MSCTSKKFWKVGDVALGWWCLNVVKPDYPNRNIKYGQIMRLQGVFDLPHRKKCTLKNCAALWDSMKGRPKHSSRESLWSMQGNSTRRNTDGDLRPKKSGFQVLKALTDGANWFLLLLESPLPSGSKSNSTSYGRAYTDLYSRKGKAGEWRYNHFILPGNNKKVLFIMPYEWHFLYICTQNKDRANKSKYRIVKLCRYGYKPFTYNTHFLAWYSRTISIVRTKSTQGSRILYVLIVLLLPVIGISIYYLIRK